MDTIWTVSAFVGAFALLIGILVVVSIPISRLALRKIEREEAQFVSSMHDRGRSLPWSDAYARLSNGNGTLIYDSLSPKGPIRLWWSPQAKPPDGFALPGKHDNSGIFDRTEYKHYCLGFVSQQLDDLHGVALLVTDWASQPQLKSALKQDGVIEVCRWSGQEPIIVTAA
ncbi:MAG TPA: hypothetical protein VEL07_07740 [Planctomycetota bacterium]|nr:hypothetical protein [Planctomycetota bacterium]